MTLSGQNTVWEWTDTAILSQVHMAGMDVKPAINLFHAFLVHGGFGVVAAERAKKNQVPRDPRLLEKVRNQQKDRHLRLQRASVNHHLRNPLLLPPHHKHQQRPRIQKQPAQLAGVSLVLENKPVQRLRLQVVPPKRHTHSPLHRQGQPASQVPVVGSLPSAH